MPTSQKCSRDERKKVKKYLSFSNVNMNGILKKQRGAT